MTAEGLEDLTLDDRRRRIIELAGKRFSEEEPQRTVTSTDGTNYVTSIFEHGDAVITLGKEHLTMRREKGQSTEAIEIGGRQVYYFSTGVDDVNGGQRTAFFDDEAIGYAEQRYGTFFPDSRK